MIDPPEELSAAGLARRDEILRQTLRLVRQRRQRRRAFKLATGVAGVVLVAILLRQPWRSAQPVSPAPTPPPAPFVGNPPPHEPTPRPGGEVIVQIIPPDPTISTRLAAPELPPMWRTIDDEQLLAAVAATGQRAGLVRINGQTLLFASR